LAERYATRNRSGKLAITSRELRPIEPVDPRMEMLRGDVTCVMEAPLYNISRYAKEIWLSRNDGVPAPVAACSSGGQF
jgi:hypothetical protein